MTSGESFGKKEHLLKSRDFARVYKKGSASRKNSFVLSFLRNDLEHNRLGFSIGSRNVKLAHSRNRIRRLFREVYRKRKKELKAGFDMVLVVKREPGNIFSYKEADNIFTHLAKISGLLA